MSSLPAQVLAHASGIAEHVHAADVARACKFGCLAHLIQLAPPTMPGVSEQFWLGVIKWGRQALEAALGANQVSRLVGG